VWEGTAAASAASTLPSQEPPLRLWSSAAAATAALFTAAGDGGGEACTGAAPALGAASAAAWPCRRGTAGCGAAGVDATDVDAMAAAAAAAAASSAAANDAFAAANAVAEAANCAHVETRQHGPTNLPTRVAAFKAGDKQLPWNALRHSRPSQNSKSCGRSLREHLVQQAGATTAGVVASRASFAAGRVSSSSPPPPPPPPPSPPKPLQPSFPPPHGDRCGRSDCLRGPEQLGVCFWCRVTLRFWANTFRQVGQVRTSDIVTTRHQRPDAMHARERDEFSPSGGSFSAACCLFATSQGSSSSSPTTGSQRQQQHTPPATNKPSAPAS
jgi:hypothetical protein